jgi:hypothetical protein
MEILCDRKLWLLVPRVKKYEKENTKLSEQFKNIIGKIFAIFIENLVIVKSPSYANYQTEPHFWL